MEKRPAKQLCFAAFGSVYKKVISSWATGTLPIFFGITGLSQWGVDVMFRIHQKRKLDFRRGHRVGVMDHVVMWTRPVRPRWMDKETYAQMPKEIRLRELKIKVQEPSFRANELFLVTTMCDSEGYTKKELADNLIRGVMAKAAKEQRNPGN